MPCILRRRQPLTALSAWILVALTLAGGASAQEQPTPSFDDVLSLRGVTDPQIATDGTTIAWVGSSADWKQNRFDREIWIARSGESPTQLTRTAEGSSTSPQWSPTGSLLAFLAERDEATQIHLISPTGGEAWALTDVAGGVSGFRWSPDGTQIAFTHRDSLPPQLKQRVERYGDFAIEDADFRMTHLWVVAADTLNEPRRLTGGDAFTVGAFAWSPDGTTIAFSHRPDPLTESWRKADLSLVTIDSGRVSPLVRQPGSDADPIWSPDGRWILFSAGLQDTAGYRNSVLARVPATGGDVEVLTDGFDENPDAVAWNRAGIWFLASIRTERRLYRLDPATRAIAEHPVGPSMVWSADFTPDGRTMAVAAQTPSTLIEIYRTPVARPRPTAVTDMTAQIAGWPLGSSEVISWPSRDGQKIEGVLWTPPDYDPSRRYPLFVVIHGGPTGTSRPAPVTGGVYPVNAWLAKGAVVLMPNYRGSAGYGEAFRALNVRNLGVGDAWDVLSGVDHLIERGIVDPEHMGAMGWSQGGYISAFLTTTSDRFAAISVGAGISDWMTYYVNTDIHSFTRTYLKATPWEDPEIYALTSPMTYVLDASTPTLIQHGEFDRRVPIPNAYQLYQGLEDVGVQTKLVVYKGFGHGISKPKERLAAMWHNWEWFGRYVWGEEVEMPIAEDGL
jgi:dipeptidyl aminopeptidase/acylaminoacyl peptidase